MAKNTDYNKTQRHIRKRMEERYGIKNVTTPEIRQMRDDILSENSIKIKDLLGKCESHVVTIRGQAVIAVIDGKGYIKTVLPVEEVSGENIEETAILAGILSQ